jgi:hypothetical protein
MYECLNQITKYVEKGQNVGMNLVISNLGWHVQSFPWITQNKNLGYHKYETGNK